MASLAPTALCPVTKKTLNCFFVVYSPKEFDDAIHEAFLKQIDYSPHILCTIEYGSQMTHKHANYLFYSSQRDAHNLARVFKIPKGPSWKVKKATSPNNVISYMTKEGTQPELLDAGAPLGVRSKLRR